MKHKLHWPFLFFSVLLLLSCLTKAHPGRTDASGGHTDRATGEYHFHHGYEAHQHTGGICPFDFDDQTNRTSTSKLPSESDLNISYHSGGSIKSSVNTDLESVLSPSSEPETVPEPVPDVAGEVSEISPALCTLLVFIALLLGLVLAYPIYRCSYAKKLKAIDLRQESLDRSADALAEEDIRLTHSREKFNWHLSAEKKKLQKQYDHDKQTLVARYNAAIATKDAEYENRFRELSEPYIKDLAVRYLKSRVFYFYPRVFQEDNPLLWTGHLRSRFHSSIRDRISIKNIPEFKAVIIGSKGKQYSTTLLDCTCNDYGRHQKPCKHMIFLHLHLGLVFYDGIQAQSQMTQLLEQSQELSKERASLQKQRQQLKDSEQAFARLLDEQDQTYPWLANQIRRLQGARNKAYSDYLLTKSQPAPKSAELVQSLSAENKGLSKECARLKSQLDIYEACFPFLKEFKKLTPKEIAALDIHKWLDEHYNSPKT